MTYAIPESRLELPWLLTRDQLGQGKVAINNAAPFAGNLLNLLMFNNGVIEDVKSGKTYVPNSGSIQSGRFFAGEGDYFVIPEADMPHEQPDATMIMKIRSTDSTPVSYATLFEATPSLAEFSMYLNSTDTTSYVIRFDSATYTNTSAPEWLGGALQTIAYAWDASGTFKAYFNGIETESQALGAISGPSWANGMSFATSDALYETMALFDWIMYFNVKLPPVIINSIYRNPYQYLVPA